MTSAYGAMMATGAMADIPVTKGSERERGGKKGRGKRGGGGGAVPGLSSQGIDHYTAGGGDDDTLSMCSQDDARSIAYSMAESAIA